MSLRNVVDNECGSVNPMVGLSKHYIRDNAFAERKHLTDPSIQSSSAFGLIGSNVQQMVNEFIAEKHESSLSSDDQPFRMDSLLREVQRLDDNPVIDDSFGTFSTQSKQWTQEFCGEEDINSYKMGFGLDSGEQEISQELADAKWADEYLAQTERQLMPNTLEALIPSTQWTQEFAAKDALSLAEEANKLMESIDPALNETDFVQFIKKIGNNEMSVDNKGFLFNDSTTADKWSQEFANKSDKWSEEFNKQKISTEEYDYHYDDDTEFWAKLAKDWKEMGLVDSTSDVDNQWLSEYNETQNKDEYRFSEENPLREHPNPFEEGLKKLKEGDIPSAVLLFEAAVQKEPTDANAWQYLGTTQAENEHDSAAIAALNKSLSLNPNDLKALMALAVSYTNESMQTQACNALKEWIRQNPKYQNLMPPDTDTAQPKTDTFGFGPPFAVSSIITSGLHKEVTDLFIGAARLSPDEADADVQCGLGVLFNLSGEYEKAADCFQSALQVRPNDSLLWNRLGATLANNSQSEQAINAYREALAISPGFIRSRFNLGISCINLGAYREAAEHFLTVLNFQAAGRGPKGSRPLMSANVWSTLRMVMTFMNRTDLLEFVDNRDLVKLNNEFQMNDPNS